MERRWILPILVTGAVMVALVGGALYFTRDNNRSTNASSGPAAPISGPTTPASSEPTTPTTGHDVSVFYLGDAATGSRLYVESHRVQATDDPASLAAAAANAELTVDPTDSDYRNPWPSGLTISQVVPAATTGDPTAVHFTKAPPTNLPAGMNASDANLALTAMVRTINASLGGHNAVQFFDGEQPMATALGVPAGNLDEGSDEAVLALVQINSPTDGAKLPADQPFIVSGVASTFEANVVWELLKGNAVIKHGVTTASRCCTLAPYSFSLTLPSGKYILIAHDTDQSGQGGPENSDTKDITIK
jgi:hypothetical protein